MAGYWKNETATREAIREGWLYTGDLGYLDADGFLYVLGRMKSLLIANDGEKFSPEVIEEALTDASPYIDQVMLFNDQSPFTVALLVPNRDAVLGWLKDRSLSVGTPEGQEAALRLLEGEIAAFREGGPRAGMFPARWLPSAVAVLGEGFTGGKPLPQFDVQDGARPHRRALRRPPRGPVHPGGPGHRPPSQPDHHQPSGRRALTH